MVYDKGDYEIPGKYQKFRRRKKRWQGGTWTPPSMSAEQPDGEWCKACKARHGYKSMGLTYEKATDGRWKLLWSCPKYKQVVAERILEPKAEEEETVEEEFYDEHEPLVERTHWHDFDPNDPSSYQCAQGRDCGCVGTGLVGCPGRAWLEENE